METIVISEDRIKIMLSREDLEAYRLDGSRLDTESDRVKAALRRVIDEAGRQTGFDTAPGRIHVQVYESKEGGCEMFVTRLPSEVLEVNEEGITLYGFADRKAMVMLCRRLFADGYDAAGDAYRLGDLYFLILHSDEPYAACDFGVLTDRSLCPYITEYGDPLICGDAVPFLAAQGVGG